MNRTELKRIRKWFGKKVNVKLSQTGLDYKIQNFNSLILITLIEKHSSRYHYIELYGYNKRTNCLYFLNIHDSIIFDCPIGIDSIGINIIQVFRKDGTAFHFSGFPLHCGMKIDKYGVM